VVRQTGSLHPRVNKKRNGKKPVSRAGLSADTEQPPSPDGLTQEAASLSDASVPTVSSKVSFVLYHGTTEYTSQLLLLETTLIQLIYETTSSQNASC
jgi:hypothetical protein